MIKRKMESNYSGWNWRRKVEEDIKRHEEITGRKVNTKEALLDYLFGDYQSHPETILDIYLLTPEDKTWKHRLNMFWAFPVTLVCAPYQFIVNGGVGWTNKGKVGKFILKSIGEDQ